MKFIKWLGLQLFADGGDGGNGGDAGDGGNPTGVTAPDAGENRLRELGVPESVLAKRAKRAKPAAFVQAAAQQQPAQPKQEAPQQAAAATQTPPEGEKTDTAKRMSWDEIMADPEYNKQMQSTIQSRLKTAKSAEETLGKLAPAIELLARNYGLDADKLDADALAQKISEDDQYYQSKAIELGVPVETAKKLDKEARDSQHQQKAAAQTLEQQKVQQHFERIQQQSEALKAKFPTFDLTQELKNPAFLRMTAPDSPLSVEDAYYAIHREEIQKASMQVTAQKTAEQVANSIRSGQTRPLENGVSAQAPSVSSFDYRHATRQQREAIKASIMQAAARGEKVYPGQLFPK